MGTHGVFEDLGIIWHNVRHGTEEPSARAVALGWSPWQETGDCRWFPHLQSRKTWPKSE